jgi:hypothetical protein
MTWAQRFKLIGVKSDAGAERRLKEPRIGCGDAVPPKCVDVSGEVLLGIESIAADSLPDVLAEDLGVKFEVPDHLKRLALGVVVQTRPGNDRIDALLDGFDEVRSCTNPYDVA